MQFTVRPLRADEGATLRLLRMSALTESPDAFGPTAEEARTHDDAYWQRGAMRFQTPHQRMYIALEHEHPVGLISAVRDRDNVGHLGAFWVDPRTRGTGLGAQLFDTALAWLEEEGCTRVELSVTEGNEQAEAMYARRGFGRTGKIEPLRDGSPLGNVFMEKVVER